MRIILTRSLIFSMLFLCSCSDDQDKNTIVADQETMAPAENDSIQKVELKKPAGNSDRHEASLVLENHLVSSIPSKDFMEISSKTVLFYQPNAKEIKAYKQEFGEESFYTVSDDNLYYTYEAEIFLEEKGIKSIHPETRYLKFKLKNGKSILFDAKAAAHLGWSTILFTPEKEPKIINVIDIEEEYLMYFGK